MKHALLMTTLLASLAVVVNAAPKPEVFQAVTPENIPTEAGAVANIFVPAATIVTVTVPYFADNYIMSGDNAWVCADLTRGCGAGFPTVSTTTAGWVFNPQSRVLKGNLIASASTVLLYARTQDIVSGSNLVGIEWSCRKCVQ